MKTFVILFYSIIFSSISFAQIPFEKYNKPSATQIRKGYKSQAYPQYNPHLYNYDVSFYKIDLEATNTSPYLEGNVIVGANVTATELDTFVLELIPDYTIDSILINNISHSFIRDFDDLIIPLETPLPKDAWIEAQIFYKGMQTDGGNWNGITTNHNITYTLSEPFYARSWFPCKQVLDDKADSVFIFITTDKNLKVGSNGLLTATVPVGESKIRYEWKTYYPTAYYLISICVGEYFEYNIYAKPERIEDSILIQNYLYSENDLALDKKNIDITATLIEAFSDLFGMYPFKDEKYGHCMAPIGGGMEHQTMTTIDGFDFELVAHELAHMWFGDYVTCGTWQDIWINEGFATYSAFLALEYMNEVFPKTNMEVYHEYLKNNNTQKSIFIPENEFDIDWTSEFQMDNLTWRIFNFELSYAKGAIILHMIRYELNNDELFFSILKTYLEQYKFSNAIGTDFKEVLETESGIDFTDFFNQWYFGEGFPEYDIQWSQEDDIVYIHTLQTPSSPETPLFKGHMDYQLVYAGGDTILRLFQSKNEESFQVYLPEEVSVLEIDPDSWLLKMINSMDNEEISMPANLESKELYLCDLYPNPTDAIVNLKFNTLSEKEILIRDTSGRTIMEYLSQEDILVLDLQPLKTGIYFIEIVADGRQETRKLVKY